MADPISPPGKRYAGKRFAVGFLLLIAAFLSASVLVNRRFEAVTARFEVLRQEWGRVAEALEVRFARIDAAAADDRGEAAQGYRRLRAAYRKSSLYDEQSRLLAELWASCEAWRGEADSETSVDTTGGQSAEGLTPAAKERLERFIAADRDIERLLQSPLGRLTQGILLLDYPPRIYPTLQEAFNGFVPPRRADTSPKR